MALEWIKEILGDAHTDEIDKKIRDEIGKGFVSKKDFEQRGEKVKTLEDQVKERDGQLEEIKKSAGDTEALNKKIEALQADNQKAADERKALEEKHAAELADRDFEGLLAGIIGKEKAKDAKSVQAHLDIAKLKESKNQSEDIKAAIEAVRKEHDYLFKSDEPLDNPVAAGGGKPKSSDGADTLRAVMGLPAEKKGD
ncbi:MAG: phage scaffolding protein [Clostridiales Family XIII bacterium]|jgi:predicted phage tail protein|nr:phage scaffolding protein [Clostridiales Family XIII bacterium]